MNSARTDPENARILTPLALASACVFGKRKFVSIRSSNSTNVAAAEEPAAAASRSVTRVKKTDEEKFDERTAAIKRRRT